MSKKRLGYKWSTFWMGSKIWKPNHLKSGQMVAILSKIILIWAKMSGFQMVRFSNGWDYSYNLTILKPEHLKSDLKKVRIPIFWGFQIPNELCNLWKVWKLFFWMRLGKRYPIKWIPWLGVHLFQSPNPWFESWLQLWRGFQLTPQDFLQLLGQEILKSLIWKKNRKS